MNDTNIENIVGRRIRVLRMAQNMSQAQLAEKCEMTPQYISLLETGKKNASLRAIIKISSCLDMSVDEFLYGVNIKNEDNYSPRFRHLLADCSEMERNIIFEMAYALKNSMRNAEAIISREDKE